MYPSKNTRWPQ